MAAAPGNDLELGIVVGTRRPLMIPRDHRGTHLHVVGATGVGKSKFLEHLVRQDIRNHHRSGCGLLVIDRHGSLYDGIVQWLAAYDAEAELPVVPIDLRRDDFVVAYNPLRPRSAAAAPVVAANVVDAIAHVWGAEGTSDTPRFAHTARLAVRALYQHRLTLAVAPWVLNPIGSRLRDALAEKSVGLDADKWQYLQGLKPTERATLFESSVNRFDPFVQNALFRSMLGQTDRSLDWGRALKRGYIVLVAAATRNAKVSEDDARVFATLLLSDLWTAAKERGKQERVRPFYLYLDEFQEFVTPTIAKSLDQSRGFGLHLTLAHQFPRQLKNAGSHGQQLYDSVMENGRSKVVFHLSHDLEDIARSLFLGTLDFDEVKHQLWSMKVVGQHEETRTSYTRNETTGRNTGTGKTVAKRQKDESDEPEETGRLTEAENEIQIDTCTSGEVEAPVMIQDFARELAGVQFRSIEEQVARAQRVLFDQRQRQCMVRLADSRVPLALYTPTVAARPLSPAGVEGYLRKRWRRWKFALTADEARRRLEEKEADLRDRFLGLAGGDDEPTSARRRVR
jgi:hypothetical protein